MLRLSQMDVLIERVDYLHELFFIYIGFYSKF